MVQQVAASIDIPISGIGGIASWRDAAEFFLLGCGTVQVCTAAMHYGYRIVEDMAEGLAGWMREKGFHSIEDVRGLSLPRVTDWKNLNLNYMRTSGSFLLHEMMHTTKITQTRPLSKSVSYLESQNIDSCQFSQGQLLHWIIKETYLWPFRCS